MLLADALGEPTSSGVEWRRYVYKDNPEQYGLAVSLGDLRFSESWVREAFYVTHGLVGEDHAATHYLEYAEPGRAR